MTNLPFHPHTRLQAIGTYRDGRPIWPVLGGSQPPVEPPPDPPAEPPADPPPDKPKDEPLGDAGKAALDKERAARKEAEKELAKYRKAEQEKAEADKSEAEKRTAAEARAEAAELRALRLEVAHAKGLTPNQAKRLVGATRDELEKDADEILADFPTGQKTPPAPKPDPSQGPKGPAQGRPTSLGQAVTAALSKK